VPADESPRLARAGHGVPVQRRGDAECVALADRLGKQLDQCVLDARVLDASGGEEKFQGAPSVKLWVWWIRPERLRTSDEIIGATSSAITSNHT
jgi:hypothetical protein